jgi:hypothetical protein
VAGGGEALHLRDADGVVLRRRHRLPRQLAGRDIGARVTGPAQERIVGRQYGPAVVEQQHADAVDVEQLAQPVLARACRLALLAQAHDVGHVLEAGDRVLDRAAFAPDRRGDDVPVALLEAAARKRQVVALHAERFRGAAGEDPSVHLARDLVRAFLRAGILRKGIEQGTADERVALGAGGVEVAVAGRHDAQLPVEDHVEPRRRLEKFPVIRPFHGLRACRNLRARC